MIDIVYTWVNGEDLDYCELCREYADRPQDLNPERYRDVYSMLKYSLRSVDLFLPWIRNVYIVTCRPQIPQWLNVEHPRVRVIHHDEIIDSRYLPTFNCNVIESGLHQIEGSSEYLLYCNDDFLFGREVELEDFLEKGERIRVLGTLFGERFRYRTYDAGHTFSLAFVEHVPVLIHKPSWSAMLDRYEKEVHRTREHKFREGSDLRMDRLYRYFLLAKRRELAKVVPFYEVCKVHQFHKITNNESRQRKRLDRIRKKRPKYFCLNDDQRDNPNEKVIELVKSFLTELLPDKSQFEK